MVLLRSYSRHCRLTWCDASTGTPGNRSASAAATRSSCAGFTQACSRQTATACTPSPASRSPIAARSAPLTGSITSPR